MDKENRIGQGRLYLDLGSDELRSQAFFISGYVSSKMVRPPNLSLIDNHLQIAV